MIDRLDEIKTKWNIPVTLPMPVPWGKDDIVWLVHEVERLRAENARLTRERDEARAEVADLLPVADATQSLLTQALRERDAARAVRVKP